MSERFADEETEAFRRTSPGSQEKRPDSKGLAEVAYPVDKPHGLTARVSSRCILRILCKVRI